MTTASIVWSEGMFIAPQHFQHSEMAMRAYVNELARLDLRGDDYGVSELVLNADALQVGKLAVREAAGVLPDRGFFRLARELVLDVPDGVVATTAYLAVPLAVFGTAQYGDEPGAHRLIRERRELRDINDPTNEPIDGEVAEIGATLILDGGDLSSYALIPVCRILEKTAEGRVVLDRSFIPHAVSISASDVLMERLEEVISLCRVRATNAASRITSSRETRSTSSLITEQFELQILNRALLALQNAVTQAAVSPRWLYEAFAGLLVELEALIAHSTDPKLVFDARDPTRSFELILAELRRKLTLEKASSVVALEWNRELFERRRLLRLIVPTRLLAEKRRPVLAITGPESTTALRDLVPLSCKVAGLSAMPELVTRGLPGVTLLPMATAPAELRDRSDAAFFTLDTSSTHWQRFLDKREALAMHVDDRIETLDASLYMLG